MNTGMSIYAVAMIPHLIPPYLVERYQMWRHRFYSPIILQRCVCHLCRLIGFLKNGEKIFFNDNIRTIWFSLIPHFETITRCSPATYIKTSTAGEHQMQLLYCHSLIIIIIFIVVVVLLKSLLAKKSRLLSFKNNTGPSYGPMDRQTNKPTDQWIN